MNKYLEKVAALVSLRLPGQLRLGPNQIMVSPKEYKEIEESTYDNMKGNTAQHVLTGAALGGISLGLLGTLARPNPISHAAIGLGLGAAGGSLLGVSHAYNIAKTKTLINKYPEVYDKD